MLLFKLTLLFILSYPGFSVPQSQSNNPDIVDSSVAVDANAADLTEANTASSSVVTQTLIIAPSRIKSYNHSPLTPYLPPLV